jgi:hypothetical protein
VILGSLAYFSLTGLQGCYIKDSNGPVSFSPLTHISYTRMELSQTPTTSSNGYSLRENNTAHTIKTWYMEILLELDSIPWFYSILANGANWMLLAGYLVLPGTFTSLQDS